MAPHPLHSAASVFSFSAVAHDFTLPPPVLGWGMTPCMWGNLPVCILNPGWLRHRAWALDNPQPRGGWVVDSSKATTEHPRTGWEDLVAGVSDLPKAKSRERVFRKRLWAVVPRKVWIQDEPTRATTSDVCFQPLLPTPALSLRLRL